MVSCGLFSTILLILTLILAIYSHIFFRKNIYPEISIVKETGNKESFKNADWWLPESNVEGATKRFLRNRKCGYGTSLDAVHNCPYDNDVAWDNIPIRSKCSVNSVEGENCKVRKPYTSFFDFFSGMFGGSGYTGGCKSPDGKRYWYADDCKGSPNNSCCQRFDRKTGFVGGSGSWCMKCKNPNPEDVEFCKNILSYHCTER